MDDEFKFLLCERCQKEVKSPKLLSCLHNLCTECLEESKPNGLCKICGTPYSQNAGTSKQDNLLFANLQANLSIYWKAVDSKDLMCDNCKEGNKKAEYWCSVCKEFLCTSCYESHQKYTRESHEIRALKGIAAGSSKEYLDWIKKRSVNSCSIHKNEPVSRYCPECRQSMCSKCALLDSIHTGLHRDLQEEIKHGRDELQGMSMELMKKKSNYSGIYERLKKLVKDKEKVKSETKALQKMIEIMMQLVQERREALLTAVEQHNRDVQDVKEKMKHMEGMLERIKSSEQLVEKMHLYASDQEVMVMHPFIRESLEELKRKQPSTVDYKRENLTEVKTQIQALFERVTGEKAAAPAISQKAFNQVEKTPKVKQENNKQGFGEATMKGCSAKSPAKRKKGQQEMAIHTPLKVIKTEPDNSGWKTPAMASLDEPGSSSAPAGGASICSDSCPEEESSDDESLDDSLLEDTIDKETGQTEATTCLLNSGQEHLVFFDMKKQIGNTLELVAVGDNSECFEVTVGPQPVLERGDIKINVREHGLDNFLCYLKTLHMPLLVGYNLWSMQLPTLFNSLEAIKEESFVASIAGFLDAHTLIKKKIPDASSYALKSLARTYLKVQLKETQAKDCAKTLKDLFTALDINSVMGKNCIISYSNLRCYMSLEPLLKLLSKPSAQILALHNISYSTLQSEYKKQPENGLERFCRFLNRRRTTEKKVKNLSKIRSHFQKVAFAISSATTH